MLEHRVRELLSAAIEELLDDGAYVQTVLDQMSIDLTPFEDDGSTQSDTYRLSIYCLNHDRWSQSVRLLDLINDQLDALKALDPGYGGRAGYDRPLEGLAAELAKCLAIVEQALRVERIKGIADGDWEGSPEAEP